MDDALAVDQPNAREATKTTRLRRSLSIDAEVVEVWTSGGLMGSWLQFHRLNIARTMDLTFYLIILYPAGAKPYGSGSTYHRVADSDLTLAPL